ncbi:MAG: RNA polymerase sigma-70 factor [Chlorobi bacterium]|nr:RNA polymerase sigma-70 factor [Chlorobiota bacterium]
MAYSGNDKKLIQGLIEGDEKAYEELFLTYYARLVVFAQKLLGDEDLSKEMVQDVFVMFYEKREVLNIHTSLKSHLYQTVRNRCLNEIKRTQIRREHHSGIYNDKKNQEAYFDDKVQQTELEARIFNIVQSLPAQCKRIFKMSRYEGINNSEIAEKLQLSKRTVETQISKALKILRQQLKGYVDTALILIFWLMK